MSKISKLNISKLNSGISLSHSSSLWDSLPIHPRKSFLLSTVGLNEKFIPGIYLFPSSKDISKFKLKLQPIEPEIKFRYLDFGSNIPVAVVEINLQIDSKNILSLFLNPANSFVKHFFMKIIETEVISFHFHNKSNNTLLSSFRNLDIEEIGWFKRNNKKLENLMYSDEIFEVALERVFQSQKIQSKYKFIDINDENYLAESSDDLMSLEWPHSLEESGRYIN